MIDQNKLRDRAKRKLVTTSMLANACNIEYTYFTRWLNGNIDLKEEGVNRIKEGLKTLKK